MSVPFVVVVTGSECTGKTTLAAELAAHYATAWSPEFARGHADAKGVPLDASDVEPIALGQMAAQDEATRRGRTLAILDTDLLSTVVYARHYYGACPAWIEAAARARRADLYLLLLPDRPWVADGVRDRPHTREQMHTLFLQAIVEFAVSAVEISGHWDRRRATAIAAIDARLARQACPGAAGGRLP